LAERDLLKERTDHDSAASPSANSERRPAQIVYGRAQIKPPLLCSRPALATNAPFAGAGAMIIPSLFADREDVHGLDVAE
jgi:hypothetical protein